MAPAKKSKAGKGKKKDAAVEAEELRLAQLRQQEREAEELQEVDRSRRAAEEKEERVILAREEQLRLLREKEKRIEELRQKLTEVASTLKENRLSYEKEIEQLSVLRDALLNEVSVLKSELAEQQQLHAKEHEGARSETERLHSELESARQALREEKIVLEEKLLVAQTATEEHRSRVESLADQKETESRDYTLKLHAVERELEKARTMNAALQQAVESHEADDRKNISLMQMLNAQLEDDRRHFDERLEEERSATGRAKEETQRLEGKCAALQESLEAAKTEAAELRRRSDGEMCEYQQQLEQVKFDAQYLTTELATMREQCANSMKEASALKAERETTVSDHSAATEALQKKVEGLESLLYTKEREFYDKTTFMNAQLANNRTVVTQLQNRLAEERESHKCELDRHVNASRLTVRELKDLNEAEARRSGEHASNEQHMQERITELTVSIRDLQNDAREREKEAEISLLKREDEIKRLRDLLDAHFIPHRQDVEASRNSTQLDTILILREKLADKEKELAAREQAAAETETWLKSRIASQAEIIESLQVDLKVTELSREKENRQLEDEVSRLKKSLEINYISCTM